LRSFYEMDAGPKPRSPDSDPKVRLFLQLAILSFWGPCAAADLYLLWRSFGREGAGAFVFWLLFRQSLVFLALWFTVSIVHGLTRGRRTAAEPSGRRARRRTERIRTAQAAGVALSRSNRGL
jgi:hypothetical protein